jgi:hypothetical protein
MSGMPSLRDDLESIRLPQADPTGVFLINKMRRRSIE